MIDPQSAPHPAPLVQPFVALLSHPGPARGEAARQLAEVFSAIDYSGAPHPFDVTDYYTAEMGEGLERILVAFHHLQPADFLVDAKLACNAIEARMAVDGRRRVNLDVGYLDQHKLVLASCKERGHKLYLAKGVWADLTLCYEERRYQPMPWTFPDFRDARYSQELNVLRELLREKLAALEA